MNSDGTGLRYFDFKAPNQVTLAAWSRRYQIDERAYKLFKWLVPPRRLVDGGRFSFYRQNQSFLFSFHSDKVHNSDLLGS